MAFIDLIFQSGEFYESETRLGLIEVIKNTLFPLIVFVLGFYIRHVYNLIQRKKELITFRDYYIDTIEFIKKSAISQSEEFRTLSEKLLQTDRLSIEIKNSPDFSTDLLWDLPKDKLYESIVQLKKGNKSEIIVYYNQILFSLQDLRFIEKNYVTIMNDLISGLKEYNQSYNNCQRELLWNRDKYFHEIHKAVPIAMPIFFTKSEEIFKTWTLADDHRTQHMVNEHLAKPLKKLCEEYPTEQYSVIYMKQLTTMLTIHENMERFSKDYSDTYKVYSEDLEKDVQSFIIAIDKLNGFNDKLW